MKTWKVKMNEQRQTIKLSAFLSTGDFGGVNLKDSKEDVLAKLGEPTGVILSHEKGLHYSMYEFAFVGNKLWYIQNDHFDPEYPELMLFENHRIKIDPEFMAATKALNFRDIRLNLERLGIEYTQIEYCARTCLKTIGNVVLDFSEERWDDAASDWVKVEQLENRTFIGFRFHELYVSNRPSGTQAYS